MPVLRCRMKAQGFEDLQCTIKQWPREITVSIPLTDPRAFNLEIHNALLAGLIVAAAPSEALSEILFHDRPQLTRGATTETDRVLTFEYKEESMQMILTAETST